jgi:transposase
VAARWRRQDDALLERLYGEGEPLRRIAERLGRSEDAIVARRRALAIARRDGGWSAPQDALIVAATRAGLPASAVAATMGIPADRVRRRRARLVGARQAAPRYDPADDAAIVDALTAGGDLSVLGERLGRSSEALRLRARRLGIHDAPQRRRWTPVEDDALRAGYRDGQSCRQIAERIGGGRSAGAVAARARKLGLSTYGRCWSATDDERLRVLMQSRVTLDAVALTLVRTPEAVRQHARKLGLALSPTAVRARSGERWTAREDALLRAHQAAHPIALAAALGRSDDALQARMRALALVAQRQRTPHYPVLRPRELSPGELALLARELLGDPEPARVLAVARRLGRPPATIRRHIRQLRHERAA